MNRLHEIEVWCRKCRDKKQHYDCMFRNGKLICCCLQINEHEDFHRKDCTTGETICCSVCINCQFIPTLEHKYWLDKYYLDLYNGMYCKECLHQIEVDFSSDTYSNLNQVHEDNRHW